MALDNATIQALLAKDRESSTMQYPVPIQVGPLRYYDKTDQCTHSRPGSRLMCKSPAHYKVQHKRRCTVHALQELNELLVEKGVIE